MNKSRVTKRSVVVSGHKTSVCLDDEFWRGLKVIAEKRLISLSDIVTAIDKQRQHGNLSSAIRLFVLESYRGPVSDATADHNLHEVEAPSPTILRTGAA